jgi:hypothetical protein
LAEIFSFLNVLLVFLNDVRLKKFPGSFLLDEEANEDEEDDDDVVEDDEVDEEDDDTEEFLS